MIFTSPLEWILASACGLVVGFLAGALGVGGSFLMVPVLSFMPSVSLSTAVGSSACQVLGPATTALLARGLKRENFRIPLILCGGLLVGVFTGGWVLNESKSLGDIAIGNKLIPATELLVFSIYLFLLTGLGLITLREVRTNRPFGTKWLQKIHVPPSLIIEKEGRTTGKLNISIPILCWFGLVTGFFSGLLGVSGGLIILPGMISLFGIPVRQSVVISLSLVWIISIQSTIVHAYYDNIDLGLVICLMLGGTIGARLGAQIGKKAKGQKLKQSLGWLLLGSATLVAIQLVMAVS